jgi:hypothetical protein
LPTNPDAVYLGHRASAIERIAELDYFEIDLEVVWRTATVNVPEIAAFVRNARGDNEL